MKRAYSRNASTTRPIIVPRYGFFSVNLLFQDKKDVINTDEIMEKAISIRPNDLPWTLMLSRRKKERGITRKIIRSISEV